MKKLLLMFVALFTCVAIGRAEESVMDFANNLYGCTSGSSSAENYLPVGTIVTNGTVEIKVVTEKTVRYWTASNKVTFRVNKNGSIEVAVPDATISKVEISGSNLTSLSTPSDGGFTKTGSASAVTFTGSGESITINSTSATAQMTQMTVTYAYANNKEDAGMSFAEAEYTVNFGSDFESPVLTKATTAEVTYTSSNEDVATVNNDGQVSILAVGDTTITAKAEANDQYNAGAASYKLIVVDGRAEAGLAFPEAIYTANYPGTFDAPELTNPGNLAVVYTSSNEEVATVSETGAITLLAAGTTVITATTEGNDQYKPGSASYTLSVKDPNAKRFVLATSLEDLYDNCFAVIANAVPLNDTYYVMSATQNKSNRYGVAVSVADNAIAYADVEEAGGQIFKLIADDDNWVFSIPKVGTCIQPSSAKNSLVTDATVQSATVTFSEEELGSVTVQYASTFTYRNLRFNPNNGQTNKIFSCYASGQQDVSIYVLQLPETEPTVTNGSISGNSLYITPGTPATINFNLLSGYVLYYKFTPNSAANAPLKVEDGNGFTKSEDGIVTVSQVGTLEYYTVNSSTEHQTPIKTMTVNDGTTGLNEVIVEEGETVYYNLQGVRVANPENGIFIRVQGGKAAKVIL